MYYVQRNVNLNVDDILGVDCTTENVTSDAQRRKQYSEITLTISHIHLFLNSSFQQFAALLGKVQSEM